MDKKLEALLLEWPKPFIRDQDLAVLFPEQEKRRYDTVKYALKRGVLVQLRRGVYLIGKPFVKGECDAFEISSLLYGQTLRCDA